MAIKKELSPEERKIVGINPVRMFQEESKVRKLLFIPEAGTKPEDCLDPVFWAHVARDLNEFAELTVIPEDWTWEAKYRVREAGPNWAKVVLLHLHNFDKLNPQGASFVLPGYEIEHAGAFARWRVIRTVDKQVIRDKFVTKADAETWLVEYAKSLAA